MKRGQAALEYMLLAAILLAMVVTVFIYTSFTAQSNINLDLAQTAVNKIARAVDQVYSSGPGSKVYVDISLPSTILNYTVSGTTIQYQIQTDYGVNDVYAYTTADTVGLLPTFVGLHRVVVTAQGDGTVRIGADFELTPATILHTYAPGASGTTTMTLTNNTGSSVSGISAQVNGDVNSILSVSGVPASLAANASGTFNANFVVPLGKPAGIYTGTIDVTSNGGHTAQSYARIIVPSIVTTVDIQTFSDSDYNVSASTFTAGDVVYYRVFVYGQSNNLMAVNDIDVNVTDPNSILKQQLTDVATADGTYEGLYNSGVTDTAGVWAINTMAIGDNSDSASDSVSFTLTSASAGDYNVTWPFTQPLFYDYNSTLVTLNGSDARLKSQSGSYPSSGIVTPKYSALSPLVLQWNSFNAAETLNGQSIDYQLSDDDGATWEYWTGTAWANTTNNWSNASVVNATISFFPTTNGRIKFRAKLNSDTVSTPILDSVTIGYRGQNYKPILGVTITRPVDANVVGDFNTTARVDCVFAGCSNVNSTLQYCTGASCTNFQDMNATGNLTTTDTNPQVCNNMAASTYCEPSWLTSPTASGNYLLKVLAQSSDANVTDAFDTKAISVSPQIQKSFSWPFDYDTNYSYDSAKVEFGAGTARIKEAAYTPDSGTVGLWHFDEGTGTSTADAAGADNTGTLRNGAAWTTTRKYGDYAIYFDGSNDRVDTTYTSAMNTTGAMTVEAWVRIDDLSNYPTIISRGDYNYNTFSYELYAQPNGSIEGVISNNGSSYTLATTSASVVTTGAWYHVAMVFSPSTYLRIYVNGVQQANNTTSIPSSLYSSSRPVVIGADMFWGSYYYQFDGRLDEVRLSNTARTSFNTTNYLVATDYIATLNGIDDTNISSWDSFSAIETIPSNTVIKYQLSDDDGTTWYQWNGSAWASTTTSADTSSAVNSHIASFSTANDKLKVRVKIRAKNGVYTPVISQMDVNYTVNI